MKFYYNNEGFSCKWKNQIKDDTWWSMEPVKLVLRLPLSTYNKILSDIKLRNEELLEFKIHKQKDEVVNWNVYSSDESELWKFTTLIDRISYTSKFNDGTVTAHFEFMVQNHSICDKSELRELLLSELV